MVRSEKTADLIDHTKHTFLPVDKGWSWVIVAGCFGIIALVIGTIKSFGVVFVEMSRKFDVSASELAGPQSLAGFFYIALGPLAKALSERYTHRVVVFTGGVLAAVGLVATSFAKSLPWFYVTYGIITGLGLGLTFSPTIVFQCLHFRKYRAIANGLSAAGGGAGVFILPYLIRFMFDVFSLKGAQLILAGIVLNICVFSTLFRPSDFWKPNQRRANLTIMQERECMVNSKEAHAECETFPIYDSTPIKIVDTNHLDSSHEDLYERYRTDNVSKANESISITHESDRHKSVQLFHSKGDKSSKTAFKSLLNWKLLKNKEFLNFAFAIFTGLFTQYSLLYFLPSIAAERGFSDNQGTSLVAVLGVCDFFGRIISGFIADFGYFERATIYRTNLGLVCVCSFISPFITSFIWTCVVAGVIGLFSGGYIGIQFAVLADKLGVYNLPSSQGFSMFFASFALLINPQIAGLIKDMTGSWEGILYMAGTSSFVGTLSLSLPPLYKYFCSHNET